MRNMFRKSQILTIPNLLSTFRLVLIPLIVWLYVRKENYRLAALVILLSGATDVADGYIARHFNMISDLGKILDPVADKLTQGTIICCLIHRFALMKGIIVLFVVKEVIMGVMGFLVIRRSQEVQGADWHGKLNTVLLYSVMLTLILFPEIPRGVANGMIVLCGCSMVVSLCLYVCGDLKVLRQN